MSDELPPFSPGMPMAEIEKVFAAYREMVGEVLISARVAASHNPTDRMGTFMVMFTRSFSHEQLVFFAAAMLDRVLADEQAGS